MHHDDTRNGATLAISTVLALAAASGVAQLAHGGDAGYAAGFVWNLPQDFTPGTVAHSTAGNPDDDLLGNLAWRYAWVSGGGLDAANPWYRQARQDMVWEPLWFGNPALAAWRRGSNTEPGLDGENLTHAINKAHWYPFSPILEWRNPTGQAVIVNVAGPLGMGWNGSASADVEIAIAHEHAGDESIDLLWSTTVEKPSGTGFQTIPLALTCVEVEPGDALLVGHRAVVPNLGGAAWLSLQVSDLTITLGAQGPADIDCNGTVGVPDLLVLLGAWGPCAAADACPADLDDDGAVGVADLLALLAAWT